MSDPQPHTGEPESGSDSASALATATAAGLRVAVFGLGEAGSLFAADLVRLGATVHAFDPAPRPTPVGVVRHTDPAVAVSNCTLVLALTAAADATTALTQALDALPANCMYADVSTSPPALMKELSDLAATRSVRFADVALMAIVPGNGLSAPAMVSGPGARGYAELVGPLGVPIEVVGSDAGDASTRKLLRSVMMKGLAAVIIEAMRGAEKAGLTEEIWANIVGELTRADETTVRRLVVGTEQHAVRRLHEMEASTALLCSLGVEPVMTNGTVENLRRMPVDGLPALPEPSIGRTI